MVAILETVTRPRQMAPGYPGVSAVSPDFAGGIDPAPLESWLKAQSVNAMRHAAAVRPFRKNEFGSGPASPSDAHIEAVNDLTTNMRRQLLETSRQVSTAAALAREEPTFENLQWLTELKERAGNRVRLIEDIWKFYLELFGQRQSKFAPQLLACDRIALDCYQYVYTGLGRTKPIPSPAPFCYMETGFSPATFRRGVRMAKIGQRANPFPLIQLPHHRLINPWTLGAVL